MKHLFLIVLSIAFTTSIYAQDSCACCRPENRAFDFWIGDWVVYDTLGNKVGENHLEIVAQTCVMRENWTSIQGGKGVSMNYFDNSDSLWHQLWVDGSGGVLNLKGSLQNGVMVLESDLTPGINIPFYINRISWTPQENGDVIQRWDILNPEKEIINTIFIGVYKLRKH